MYIQRYARMYLKNGSIIFGFTYCVFVLYLGYLPSSEHKIALFS